MAYTRGGGVRAPFKDTSTRRRSIDHALLLNTPSLSPYTMKLGGCKVDIECNGRFVREVGTAVAEDGKTVSCYIISQPGKVSVETRLPMILSQT